MRRAVLWSRLVVVLVALVGLGAAAGPARTAAVATFDYSMPDRFGEDGDGDGAQADAGGSRRRPRSPPGSARPAASGV